MNEKVTHIIPVGTQIAEFTIKSILGEGGFGITYLAYDEELKRKVAIKEYFPAEMTIRGTNQVTVNAKSNTEENYQFGLNKFLEEAQTLAQFSHPNIVRVTRFIKTNNTAYLIMDFEEGEDLSVYLKRTKFQGNMPETELKSYLVPILNGLQAVHDKGLLHRDVKPGNIYLRKDAEPMLIDFGAARYALGEHSKSMSAIISMGYAPPEQYSSKAKQTPASDLYAWGATAYQLITGKPPVESPDRSNAFFEGEDDPLKPLSQTHAGKYSKELLSTIDNCLQIANKNRPASAVEVLAILNGEQVKTNKTKIVKPEDRFKSSHSNTGTKYVKEDERFTNTKPKQNSMSSSAPIGTKRKGSQQERRDNPANKTPILKYATIFLVLVALGTGSYFGYDYYQTQQAETEKIRLAEQKAKDKAEKEHHQAWSQAQQTNTIASYQAYLGIYPAGANQSQANDKIKQLKDELGNLTTQAQKLLVKLGYQVPSSGKLDARTEAAIKDFEAKQKILVTGNADQILLSSLQQVYIEKDQAAWNLAQGNVEALQNYDSDYPDGKYINQVSKTIQQINLAKEQIAWNKAQGNIYKLQQYANNYPDSQYSKQIEGNIEKIKQQKIDEERQKLARLSAKIALGKDGMIEDESKNLSWMRCSLGQNWNKSSGYCDGKAKYYSYNEAKAIANRSDFAGYTDWRLPTLQELDLLVYCSTGKPKLNNKKRIAGCPENSANPTIDNDKFPNTPRAYFWSVSTYPTDSLLADNDVIDVPFGINFMGGYSYESVRKNNQHVRLVRFIR